MVVVLDRQGRIRYLSPSALRVFGYPDEPMEARALTLVHPEDVRFVVRSFLEVVEPAASTTIEFRARHGDGSWRHVEAVVTNLASQPAVAGFVLNVRDVTERKRAEFEIAAARESDNRRYGAPAWACRSRVSWWS